MDTLLALLVLAAAVVVAARWAARYESRPQAPEEGGWSFGEEWKEGTPETAVPDEDTVFVELWRSRGKTYTDADLVDLVGYLSSRGVRAIFDTYSIASHPLRSYVLKVEVDKLEEAKTLLKSWLETTDVK